MNFNSGTTQQQNQGGVNPFLAFAAGAGAGAAPGSRSPLA